MGHHERLGRAAREHAKFLRTRLRSLGVDEARLDDAVQDVLEVLARRIEAYDERFSVRQWMAGVARNVARRHRRHAAREPATIEAEPAGTDDPERAAVRREAAEMLERFLAELDPDRWAVFVLSEVEGLRGTEIAAELGVNLSTVYARLRSAQRAFDRALARYRAREHRFAWLAVFVPRPATSLAAVSVRLLAGIAFAVIAAGTAAWLVAADTRAAGDREVARAEEPPPMQSALASIPTRGADEPEPEPATAPRNDPEATAPTPSSAATDAQREAIAALAALYRDFDDARFHAIFDVEAEPWVLREQFEWFASVVGECGPPELLRVVSGTRARFVFRCETGELEAEIVLADPSAPTMTGLLSGARGVDPPEPVIAAAHRVLALYHAFDATKVPALFEDDWDPVALEAALAEARADFGRCTLGEPDLARHRGALFDLACEAGPRLLKVELDDEDDRIERLFFSDPRPDAIREG